MVRALTRTLGEIAREMEELADRKGDQEIDHGRADGLLLEAIELLAPLSSASRIVAAYERVEKWYA